MITLTREEAHGLLAALEELNRLNIGKDAISLPAEIDTAMEILEARLNEPTCPPCNENCNEGRDCPARKAQPEPAETNERLRIGQHAMIWYDGQGNVIMKADGSGTKVIPPHPAFAQREWHGLTDEELNLIYAEPQTHSGQYARAIEAKLKEKNNKGIE
jgi:hypothetical protein